MTGIIVLSVLAFAAAVWCGWRISSRRAVMPCPSELWWLVELENPIARATRSEEIVHHLCVLPGERIMDIGCGPGRVTMRLAEAVGPCGEIYAVDVQSQMLAIVHAKAETRGFRHVRCLQIQPSSSHIEVKDADAAVMVMMLGEVPDAQALLQSVGACLKEGGRLVVAESVFDPHCIRRAKLQTMTRNAGFVQMSIRGNLFGYSMLFRKTNQPN